MSKKYLLIAGTYPAGTNSIVHYLNGLGFETHLPRTESILDYEGSLNAENEATYVPPAAFNERPYVMASSWPFELIGQCIMDENIQIDAVIIPVGDIVQDVQSKITNELTAACLLNPWMQALDQTWEAWGTTSGGMITSFNPMDQARMMSLMFHRLVDKLVKNRIKIVFLHLPEALNDSQYVYSALKEFIPENFSEECAVSLHRQMADVSKIVAGEELSTQDVVDRNIFANETLRYEGLSFLDNLALKRQITQLNEEVIKSRAEATKLRNEAKGYLDALANTERLLNDASEFWRTQLTSSVKWGEKELERHTPETVLPLLIRHLRALAG